jgi:hypothetical protein
MISYVSQELARKRRYEKKKIARESEQQSLNQRCELGEMQKLSNSLAFLRVRDH